MFAFGPCSSIFRGDANLKDFGALLRTHRSVLMIAGRSAFGDLLQRFNVALVPSSLSELYASPTAQGLANEDGRPRASPSRTPALVGVFSNTENLDRDLNFRQRPRSVPSG